jgi:hypothetical protein
MAVWFEGQIDIRCSISDVERALDNLGEFFTGVVSRMPGMASVELTDQGSDSVTITTNEGVMTRTNLSKRTDAGRVVLEYDERYEAGSKVTATSRFRDEYTQNESGVTYRLVMSDVEAPGVLGFFYRKLGSSKIGNAFLEAEKAYLEDR